MNDYVGKSEAVKIVRFAIDGVNHESDLSLKDAGKLRLVFERGRNQLGGSDESREP